MKKKIVGKDKKAAQFLSHVKKYSGTHKDEIGSLQKPYLPELPHKMNNLILTFNIPLNFHFNSKVNFISYICNVFSIDK